MSVYPAATASFARRTIFSSVYPSQPGVVVYAGNPSARSFASLAARCGSVLRNISSASAGVSASVMYLKSTSSTICSGVRSERNFHKGFFACFVTRSHAALTTAPAAICVTPFSGPNQRICESRTKLRANSPMLVARSATSRPTAYGASCSIMSHCRSFPRPHVKTKPWPSSVGSSVSRMSRAAE